MNTRVVADVDIRHLTCMYVCLLCTPLVLAEARRRHQVFAAVVQIELQSSSKKQPVSLTAELFLHPSTLFPEKTFLTEPETLQLVTLAGQQAPMIVFMSAFPVLGS